MSTFEEIVNEMNSRSGLNVSPLPKGMKLSVETKNSFYDIVIMEAKEITIFGGATPDGGTRFAQPVRAILLGSTFMCSSALKVDWIGHGLNLEIALVDSGQILRTSPVQNVVIESPHGDWSYDFCWKS